MKAKPKTYARCIDLGETIGEAVCQMDVVIAGVANTKVKKGDPFYWRNLTGVLQSLHDMKKKAPELRAGIESASKDAEALRGLIYRSPNARRRINAKYVIVRQAVTDLRTAARNLCSDA